MRFPEGIGRNINPPQAIGGDLKDLRIEESETTSHEDALEALLMVHRNVDGDVACTAFKNSLRVRKWRAATPASHRPRVARGGCVAMSEGACHVEGVTISPVGATLRFRKNKSTRYEGARFKVEFTDHGGIGTAPREDNEATAMIGWQRRAAVPDPVLAFIASKRVDIDQHVPFG